MRDAELSLIAVVSPKGGVGKTTVTANLARCLAADGHRVLVLDLDPQNALRLHLQLSFDDVRGLAVQSLNDAPWSLAMQVSPSGVSVLPFGALDEGAVAQFEALCADDPDCLLRGLASLNLAPQTLVLVDTPPGSGPQVRQLLSLTQAMLGVLLPDTASLVTVSTLERWLATYCLGRPDFITAACVINAVPDADGLAAEVAEHLSNRLAAHMACLTIGHSTPLRESFAAAQRLSEYAPAAAVEADFRDLAQWLVTHI